MSTPADDAYLAKTAANALRLAIRGSSLEGEDKETLLELAEDAAEKATCLFERLENEAKAGEAGKPKAR
jgi:hypothetical protein